MRSAGHKISYFLLCKPETSPYTGKNGLASNRRERHIDSVQRHPVEFPLPLLPAPIWHGVAESADIHILPVFERGRDNLQRSVGKSFGKLYVIDCPCEHSVMTGGHIVIESPACRGDGTALHNQFAVLCLR